MARETNRRLEALARRKQGVFTRQEAMDLGIPRSTLSRRTRSGTYRQLQPGVYAISGAPDVFRARLLAAVLAAGRGAVLSHASAAHHWAFENCPQPGSIHVLSSARLQSRPQVYTCTTQSTFRVTTSRTTKESR